MGNTISRDGAADDMKANDVNMQDRFFLPPPKKGCLGGGGGGVL